MWLEVIVVLIKLIQFLVKIFGSVEKPSKKN